MRRTSLLSTAALTLILGVTAAAAQSGTQQRRNDTQNQAQQTQQQQPAAQTGAQNTQGQQPGNNASNAQNQSSGAASQNRQTTGQSTGSEPTQAQQNGQQQPMNSAQQNGAQQGQQPNTSQSAQQPANTRSAQQPANSQSAQQPSNTQSAQQPSNTQSAQQPTNDRSAQQPTANERQNAQTQPSSGAATQQSAGTRGNVTASGEVALSSQQRTRVASAIRSAHIRPIGRVNFSVNVGTRVPSSVQLEALPSTVVDVLPQYRGYRYFATEDRLVIVDPRSEEIVAFLPYEGASRAQAPARSSHYSRLNTKQREMIRKEVHVVPHTRTTTTTHVTVGERVPDSVELREFPERIYSEVPEMRHYRYYAPAGGGVTIVDPDAHTIVDTIE